MSYHCSHCQASIADSLVDQSRQIGTCGACGRIVDLQPQMAASSDAKPRMRETVSLPDGMALRDDGEAIIIERRWLRTKHWAFLLVLTGVTGGVAWLWSTDGYSLGLLIGSIILASWDIRVLSMFVNTTKIKATSAHVDVRHGPLPSIMFRNQSMPASELRQLFAAKFGAVFEVGAELADGRRIPLVRPLATEEQALFVEQRLEQRLGLVDYEVDGELGLVEGRPVAVSPGTAGALGVLPLIIVPLILVLFFAMTSIDVEGSFQASGERLGTFTFTPDDCSSGETRGFFGVELTSDESETVIRAVRDPVRGPLIAIERGGNQPFVLTPAECTTLDVQVDKTNTNVNDVWAVRGRAQVECAELTGTVTFDGCH